MTDEEREKGKQIAELSNPEVAEMVVEALAEGVQYARARYDELSPEERELLRKQEEILSKRRELQREGQIRSKFDALSPDEGIRSKSG